MRNNESFPIDTQGKEEESLQDIYSQVGGRLTGRFDHQFYGQPYCPNQEEQLSAYYLLG